MASGEPSPRFLPFSAAVGNKFYVWGGGTTNFHDRREKKALASNLHKYNPANKSWTQDKCNGTPPTSVYAGACVFSEDQLYLYGGSDGNEWLDSLHQLNMKTRNWKLLSSAGNGPSRKGGCEMVAYQNKLILFGGYGVPPTSTQSAQWDGEMTNELHTFDVEDGESVRLCPCW